MTDWRTDNGRPAYALPLIVQTPDGPKDISDWAAKQQVYDYGLYLRSGTSDWSARVFVPREVLVTLEHGHGYTRQELGVNPAWQATNLALPEKLQFIVERLR